MHMLWTSRDVTEDRLAGLYKQQKIWRTRTQLLEGICYCFKTVKHTGDANPNNRPTTASHSLY